MDDGRILRSEEAEFVDNAWSAPAATGCGGVLLEGLIDPVINTASGLPAAAGKNTAILINTAYLSSALAVKINDEENP